MTKSKTVIVENANSRGMILDYYGSPSNTNNIIYGIKPSFNLSTALSIVKNEPIVKAAVVTLTDKVLESGWTVLNKKKNKRIIDEEDKLLQLRFDKVLRKVIFNLIIYNNAFIEIIKKGEEPTDLNVLEAIYMEIEADDFGNIKGYSQNAITGKNAENTKPRWTPEQIWQCKMNEITTNVWADLDFESLYTTCLLKEKVRDWIRWFFNTNQSKILYNLKNAGDQKVRDFLSYLKASEADPSKPVIIEGDATTTIIRKFSEEGQSLNQLLDWCDIQILAILQVPPVAVGKMDVSGRSNSVEAYASLATRVYAIQSIIENDVTYDLFPKIGFTDSSFSFGVLDYVNEKKVFEIIKMMKDSGFSEDAIQEWMTSQGMIFETDMVFNPKPEINSEDVASSSEDKTKNKDELSKKFDPSSTRDNQLVTNSFPEPKVLPSPSWVI